MNRGHGRKEDVNLCGIMKNGYNTLLKLLRQILRLLRLSYHSSVDRIAVTYKVKLMWFLPIINVLSYIHLSTISCSNPAGWNLHPDIISDHLGCHAGYSCSFLKITVAVGVLTGIGREFLICLCSVSGSRSGTYSKSICLKGVGASVFVWIG